MAGLRNSVSGITIIAIGTSLPDTFASRSAALHDIGADASIGNITGLYTGSSFHKYSITSYSWPKLVLNGTLVCCVIIIQPKLFGEHKYITCDVISYMSVYKPSGQQEQRSCPISVA